jgi:ATP-dependent RNA helicase MRH4
MALSRDSDERKQAQVLAEFTGATVDTKPGQAIPPVPRVLPGKRQLTNTKVLVMTDLGSRGIDTLMVRNVILYDVPHTSIDFIHRLGRVGRMGRRGRGIVLVGKGDRRDIVKEVRDGMFKGAALI